jgi:hypothetical protein
MKYKCLTADQFETWLTVDEVYDGEQVFSPKEFSGGVWILLKRADDGFPAYVRTNQFIMEKSREDRLGV